MSVNWAALSAVTGAGVSGCALFLIAWRMVSFLGKLSRLHPVVMEMAEQFKTDTGSSLKDQINRLETAMKDNATAVRDAKEVAELARQASDRQTAVIETVRTELLRQGDHRA